MRDLIFLLVHTVITVLRVIQPGGVRAVIAESVLTKHQLLILNRSRRRAPNLRFRDRLIAGLCSLWISPKRRPRLAIAFKPSTFLNFHRALVQRKYRLLFSPEGADGGLDSVLFKKLDLMKESPQSPCEKPKRFESRY